MALPLYLAITGEDFSKYMLPRENLAWMACEFSQCDSGLSNLPPMLPKGSMLILNDSAPLRSHHPDMILFQLEVLVAQGYCNALLLDFQRPYNEKTQSLARQIVTHLSCPVGVSHTYAEELDCPVFLPPVPLNKTPDTYFLPWKGREIWLDIALDAMQIRVTPQGSQFTPILLSTPGEYVFTEPRLHCNYFTTVAKQEVCFTLYRTKDTLSGLLQAAERCGVTRCIGLYQELYKNSL